MCFNLPKSVTPRPRNADTHHQRGEFKHSLPIIPTMPREASSYRTLGLLFLINSYIRKIKIDSLTNIPWQGEGGLQENKKGFIQYTLEKIG